MKPSVSGAFTEDEGFVSVGHETEVVWAAARSAEAAKIAIAAKVYLRREFII